MEEVGHGASALSGDCVRTATGGQPKAKNEICAQQKHNPQTRLQCGFKRIKTESEKKREQGSTRSFFKTFEKHKQKNFLNNKTFLFSCNKRGSLIQILLTPKNRICFFDSNETAHAICPFAHLSSIRKSRFATVIHRLCSFLSFVLVRKRKKLGPSRSSIRETM